MRVPLVIGWGDEIRRTGAIFHSVCPKCGQLARMHEAVQHSNVNAFMVISLWDGEERACQCGECLEVFVGEASDTIRARAEAPPTLMQTIAAALPTWLASRQGPAPTPAPSRSSRSAAPSPRRRVDESEVDAELAALKKRLGK